MTVFHFTELVNDPLADVVSAALGVDADNGYVQNDVGKGVKLAAGNKYVPLADGDEIEGVVVTLSPETVNDGFSFGSIQKNRRLPATIGVAEAGTLTVGELVVSDAPVALGTAGLLTVKTGTPSVHVWRVIRIVTGTGAAGDTCLIERI
jgi:hypothetical protein